jgi:post-segregation antitoxin (ccd killing protein)
MMPIRHSPGRPGRSDPPAPQRQRTLYLPVEVDSELVDLAAKEGVSVHALMRRALVEWIEQKRESM